MPLLWDSLAFDSLKARYKFDIARLFLDICNISLQRFYFNAERVDLLPENGVTSAPGALSTSAFLNGSFLGNSLTRSSYLLPPGQRAALRGDESLPTHLRLLAEYLSQSNFHNVCFKVLEVINQRAAQSLDVSARVQIIMGAAATTAPRSDPFGSVE